MNSLSWLLYGAEIVGNLRVLSGLTAAGAGVVACLCAALSGAIRGGYRPDETELENAAWLFSKVKPLAVICIFAAFTASVLPSRNTIMLVAASEVGENIVTSEQAQQIGGEAGALATDSLRVLRKFINDQLAEDEK